MPTEPSGLPAMHDNSPGMEDMHCCAAGRAYSLESIQEQGVQYWELVVKEQLPEPQFEQRFHPEQYVPGLHGNGNEHP